MAAHGPLWVALGDSAAQGLGTGAPDRGYAGQLLSLLRDIPGADRVMRDGV